MRDRKLAPSQARGIALILALIFLIILTGIGVYMAKRSSLELRMAGNVMSKAQTFERAEEARIGAETVASTLADALSAGGTFNCNTTGYFAAVGVGGTIGTCKALAVGGLKWDNTDSIAVGNGRYAIEYQGRRTIVLEEDRFSVPVKQTEVHGFRIATRGAEASGGRTVLETVYLRRASG